MLPKFLPQTKVYQKLLLGVGLLLGAWFWEHFFYWVKCVLIVVGAHITVGADNRVGIQILNSKLLATEVASRSAPVQTGKPRTVRW